MLYTREQFIRILREAAQHWWFDFRDEFRPDGYNIDFGRVRQQLLSPCGVVNSGISGPKKLIAEHFEMLDQTVKEELVEEALDLYATMK